jgi:hypothetical protein
METSATALLDIQNAPNVTNTFLRVQNFLVQVSVRPLATSQVR